MLYGGAGSYGFDGGYDSSLPPFGVPQKAVLHSIYNKPARPRRRNNNGASSPSRFPPVRGAQPAGGGGAPKHAWGTPRGAQGARQMSPRVMATQGSYY